MTAQRVEWLRDTDTVVMATVWPEGMAFYNTTTKRWHIGDGVTAGGIPMAKLSEIAGASITSAGFATFVNSLPSSPGASGTTWNNGGIPTVVP